MDYYGKPPVQKYLSHHGILGQKWGKRNGPPYPIDDSDHSASEKKAGWRKSLDKQPSTSAGHKHRSTDGSSAQKKSKHRSNLEQSYLKKGLTQEEAEVQAYKRERMEKVLAVAGGLTVAAIAGYAAYKYHGKTTDKLIKPEALMRNISLNDNLGIRDAFSSQHIKIDSGTHGQSIQGLSGKVHDKKFSGSGSSDPFATIKERHQMAAQQLKENLSEMSKDSVTYEEKLKQINDDLDDLLK